MRLTLFPFHNHTMMLYICERLFRNLHGKKDFTEESKILLNTDLKIILLDHQNNFVRTLKIMNNAAKNFDILTNNLSVQYIILIV